MGLILVSQLMLPPVVGLANNGDFGKMLGYFGMGAPPEHEFIFADTHYTFERRYKFDPGFYSSGLSLIPPAIGVNALVSNHPKFDLRCAGLVHGALFLMAFGLFISLISNLGAWIRWPIALCSLLMFGDVAYVSYLNSFYMDVSSYLFLMLAVVFFLRTIVGDRGIDALLTLISCLLLLVSKPQHAVLAVPLAAVLCFEPRRIWRSPQVRILVTAIVFLAGLASLRYTAPPYHQAKGAFSLVFVSILPHARNQDQALADLGLDASYKAFVGKTAYSEGTRLDDPQVSREFLRHASYLRLARFFLLHPRDAYQAICTSLSEAGRQRPSLGNYDSGSGFPPWTESATFSFWSNAKRLLFFQHGARYLLSFLLLIVGFSGVLLCRRRNLRSGAVSGGLGLVAMALLELVVPAFADAIDVPRHFLLFYTLCDLLLLAGLYLGLQAIATRRLITSSPRDPLLAGSQIRINSFSSAVTTHLSRKPNSPDPATSRAASRNPVIAAR